MTNDRLRRSHRLTWQGIEIEAIYDPNKWNAAAHLEIRSIRPVAALLQNTETGYRSHFHPPGTIEALGDDVIAHVIVWLDEETAKRACRGG